MDANLRGALDGGGGHNPGPNQPSRTRSPHKANSLNAPVIGGYQRVCAGHGLRQPKQRNCDPWRRQLIFMVKLAVRGSDLLFFVTELPVSLQTRQAAGEWLGRVPRCRVGRIDRAGVSRHTIATRYVTVEAYFVTVGLG